MTSTLSSLRTRLTHLAGSLPQPLPTAWSSKPVELSLAAGLVLHRLELWASTRPDFEPPPEATVWHTPDEGDRALARNCPQLAAALAEPCLVHAAGVLESRLADLFTEYQAAGVPDAAGDAALADVDSRLAEILAAGVRVPDFAARWLAPLQRIS